MELLGLALVLWQKMLVLWWIYPSLHDVGFYEMLLPVGRRAAVLVLSLSTESHLSVGHLSREFRSPMISEAPTAVCSASPRFCGAIAWQVAGSLLGPSRK